MKYKDHRRNHLVLPGRERALENFLNQTHEGVKHKQHHKRNPNSEDALTWSCFEMVRSLPVERQFFILSEVFEDAFSGKQKPIFQHDRIHGGDLSIHIGKTYTGATANESTELDASVELPGALIFIEAKLYSAVSPATATKRDQIARKLRVGLDAPLGDAREFFFIFQDLAPPDKLLKLKRADSDFVNKWRSAECFNHYKNAADLTPLREALHGIDAPPPTTVAANMGWLTWASLFKSILRGMV